MYLQSARLFSFRNLKDTEVQFHPSVNLISGENGQGKSNLIEAIHVLSATKTFRSVQQKDLALWDSSQFSVFGTVIPEEREIIDGSGVALGVSFEGRSKKVFVDGAPTRKVADYLRLFPTVTFAPRDIDLIYGSPSGRRKLFDRYCSLIYPTALGSITAYQKVLRSKNALLKERSVDTHQIETLNELLAQHAEVITRHRLELIEALQPHIQEYFTQFAAQDGEVVLLGEETFLERGASDRSIEAYRVVLNQMMQREIDRRGALVGPQIDDMSFFLGGRAARQFSSQGQARSIVLSLLLSLVTVIEQKLGVVPTLLLDDFSSELDQGRMQRFFELLKEKSHQVFITGTDFSHSQLGEEKSAHFQVNSGAIRQL